MGGESPSPPAFRKRVRMRPNAGAKFGQGIVAGPLLQCKLLACRVVAIFNAYGGTATAPAHHPPRRQLFQSVHNVVWQRSATAMGLFGHSTPRRALVERAWRRS